MPKKHGKIVFQEIDIHRAIATLVFLHENKEKSLTNKKLKEMEQEVGKFAKISHSLRNTFKALEINGVILRKEWKITNKKIENLLDEKRLLDAWELLKDILFPNWQKLRDDIHQKFTDRAAHKDDVVSFVWTHPFWLGTQYDVRTSGGARAINPITHFLQTLNIGYKVSSDIPYFVLKTNGIPVEEIKWNEKFKVTPKQFCDFLISKKMKLLDAEELIRNNLQETKDTNKSTFLTESQRMNALWLHLINAPTRPIDGIIRNKPTNDITSGNGMYIHSLYHTLGAQKNLEDFLQEISIYELKTNLSKVFDFKNNKIKSSNKAKDKQITQNKSSVNIEELDLESAIVKKREGKTHPKKGRTASEGKDSREKAEKTGETAEEIAFIFLKKRIQKLTREIGIECLTEKYITQSKDDDDMGYDFRLDIPTLDKEYYEVKAVPSFTSFSFKVTKNQINQAEKYKEKFQFLFVNTQTSEIKKKIGLEVLKFCELNPMIYNATIRDEEHRNFEEIQKSFK